MKREEMDGLIRDALRQNVTEQEPSENVRAGLLAKAEAYNAESEMVVGAPIPPLVNGLREVKPALHGAVRLPELEAELLDFFGAAQQRLVAAWMLSGNSRY
jgi:hypothetical protein